MTSLYPAILDAIASDKQDYTDEEADHAPHHNDLADALKQVQLALGVDPAGWADDIRGRLSANTRTSGRRVLIPTGTRARFTDLGGNLVPLYSSEAMTTLAANEVISPGEVQTTTDQAYYPLAPDFKVEYLTADGVTVLERREVRRTADEFADAFSYGAKGGAVQKTCSITAGTALLSGLSAADEGKTVIVPGAGAYGSTGTAPLITTVGTVTGGVGTLAANATTTVTNATVAVGWNDQAAIDAAVATGKKVKIVGQFLVEKQTGAVVTTGALKLYGIPGTTKLYWTSKNSWPLRTNGTAPSTAINLAANGALGDHALAIADVSTLKAGDFLLVNTTRLWRDTNAAMVVAGDEGVQGEVVRAQTVASTAASGAQALPSGPLNVVSTAGFAPAGSLYTPNGVITYTGKATGPTRFTGCAGGTGTLADGAAVTQVMTFGHLVDNYATADAAKVQKMNYAPGTEIVGIEFINASPRFGSSTVMELRYCWRLVVDQCRFVNTVGDGVKPYHCYGGSVTRCGFEDGNVHYDYGGLAPPEDYSAAFGYGVNFAGTTHGMTMDNCWSLGGHHGCNTTTGLMGTLGGIPRYNVVQNCQADRATTDPFHTHGAGEFNKHINCNITRPAWDVSENPAYASGFRIGARFHSLINCSVDGGHGVGLTTAGATEDLYVQNFTVRNSRAASNSPAYAVRDGGFRTKIRGLTVDGCLGTGGVGLYIHTTASGGRYSGLKISNTVSHAVWNNCNDDTCRVDDLDGEAVGGYMLFHSTPLATTANGAQALPAATITVANTTGFATAGNLLTPNGVVAYTGLTGTTFTGCTGGTGTLANGAAVTQGAGTLEQHANVRGSSTSGLTNKFNSLVPREHFRVTLFHNAGSGGVFTDLPAAVGEFLSVARWRKPADLRRVNRVQLTVGMGSTAGAAGTRIGVQFSTDNQATWTAAVMVDLATPAASTSAKSGWVDIPAAAKIDDCWLRPVGSGGDGATDPTFCNVELECR